MLKLSCHCGQVRIELDRRPDYIRECNGTLCGWAAVTTHFTLTEGAVAKFGNTMMGVNMRLADEGDLAGSELRYPDGRAWPGHRDFGYVREARIIGE